MTTVGVNGRTVVHKGSKGFSVAPVDICFTPPGPIEVPYVNMGVSASADDEAASVFSEGHRVMNAASCFSVTSGDEPGVNGGVISGTFMGKASFANFSCDVYIEGLPTPRAFDPMFHNHGSPHNAFGPAEIQAAIELSGWEIVCKAICFCQSMDLKMVCFRITLAELRFAKGPYGHGPIWDPLVPGVWIEVPYYEGPPPGVYYSDTATSKRHTDHNGNPLPMPAPEYPPPPGSSRPDVVIVHDKNKPPEPGNIKEVYEVKFPPDDFKEGSTQLERYRRVTGVDPQVATPAMCGCGSEEEQPDTPPMPLPHKGPQQYPKNLPTAPLPEPKKRQERPSPLDPPWDEPLPVPKLTPLEITLLGLILLIASGLIPVPA